MMILNFYTVRDYLNFLNIDSNVIKILEFKKSRNFCFLVIKNEEKSLFIKQCKSNRPELIREFYRELDFYEFIEQNCKRVFFCNLLKIDRFNKILVLEAIFTKNQPSVKTKIPDAHLSEVVKVLIDLKSIKIVGLEFLPKTESLRIFKIESFLTSSSSKKLITILNKFPKLRSNIENCDSLWSTNSLMHGDIKFENFIGENQIDIKIIDFETISIGDWYWDLACIIQNLFFIYFKEFENMISFVQYDVVLFETSLPSKIKILTDLVDIKSDLDKIKLIKFSAIAILNKIVELDFGVDLSNDYCFHHFKLSDEILKNPAHFKQFFFN